MLTPNPAYMRRDQKANDNTMKNIVATVTPTEYFKDITEIMLWMIGKHLNTSSAAQRHIHVHLHT